MTEAGVHQESSRLGAAEAVEGRSTLLAIGRVLSTSAAARALGVLKGLAVAKLLAPEMYGVAAIISVTLSYAQYADLGSGTAAYRELTAALGRADAEGAARAARWMASLKLGSIGAVSVVCLALSFWPGMPSSLALGFTLFPLIAVGSTLLYLVQLRWQAQGRVREFSRATVLAGAADLILSVLLTWLWGLTGLLTGAALAPMVVVAWAWRRRGSVAFSAVPLLVVRRHLIVGLPLVALALIDHNLIYVDQLLVLAYFSVRDVGIYNIALVATEAIRMLGITAGVVLGPRLIREYARAGGDLAAIRRHTLLPVHLYACFVPPVVAGVWIAGGYVITRFYASYAEAIRPMQVLLIAFYFLVVTGGLTSFSFAIDRHQRNLLIILPALCFNVLVDIVLIREGWGLMAIAAGSLVTYVLYAFTQLSYCASYFALSGLEWVTFHAGAFLPGFYLAAVLAGLEHSWDYRASVWAATQALVAVWLLLAPLMWRGIRLAQRLEPTT